jgi:hypothetical protein
MGNRWMMVVVGVDSPGLVQLGLEWVASLLWAMPVGTIWSAHCALLGVWAGCRFFSEINAGWHY